MATEDEREDQPGASPAALSTDFTAGGTAAGLEKIRAHGDDLISSSSFSGIHVAHTRRDSGASGSSCPKGASTTHGGHLEC